MSEVITAPEDEVIEATITEAPESDTQSLFTLPEIPDAATPVEEPTAPEPAPEQSAEVTPSLPDWLPSDPAERKTVLEAAIAALPIEERVALAPVQEIARNTADYTAAQTAQRVTAELSQQSNDATLEQSATAFTTELANWLPAESGIDLMERTNGLIADAQANYHTTIVQDMQGGIAGALSNLGVQHLPAELVQAVDQAPSLGGVIQTYLNFAANVGYQAGMGAGAQNAGKRSEADKLAERARIENEVKANLVKEGWREPIAPSLSGSVAQPSDGGLMDEAEFNRIVSDPVLYEQHRDRILRTASAVLAGG